VTCKVIVSRDVSFNQPRILKEEENAKTLSTNMNGSFIPSFIEGEIGHYICNDMPQEEAFLQEEATFKQYKVEEQTIDDEPLTIALDDQDQAETFTKRSYSRTSNAPEKYETWANSSLLKDSDIIGEQENEDALILEEKEPFSYNEAQTCEAKLK
jgi:hypothetical protein